MTSKLNGTTMKTRDLNFWTAAECASALIDYKTDTFEAIQPDPGVHWVELIAGLLAITGSRLTEIVISGPQQTKVARMGPN
jgi:hypothetical protein